MTKSELKQDLQKYLESNKTKIKEATSLKLFEDIKKIIDIF